MNKYVKCLFTNIGQSVVILAYLILGGVLFSALESAPNEGPRRVAVANREVFIEMLWQSTRRIEGERLKPVWENTTKRLVKSFEIQTLANIDDGWDGYPVGSKDTEWTFSGSLLYSVCLITTIGYGNIAPATDSGRLVTIIYATFGIPLFLFYLSGIGLVLARSFGAFFKRSVEKATRGNKKQGDVPIYVSLLIGVSYILLGAIVFSAIEPTWGFLTAAYFVFITLSTIGLGDYVAGVGPGYSDGRTLFLTSFYLLVGMALLSMIFRLIQQSVKVKMLAFNALLAGDTDTRSSPKRESGKRSRKEENSGSHNNASHSHAQSNTPLTSTIV